MSSQEPALQPSPATVASDVQRDVSPMPVSIRSLTRGRIQVEHAAIALIALMSLGLGLFRIDRLGTANPYYAAAVKSMTESWHAFLFVSFDRIGFVSVDKPPLGLWDQALLADIFGFHGWVIILPQVLALTGSVILLYHLVTRVFGPTAGIIAALVLALTPISVAAARNNTSDSMLVFVLLLATWAVMSAITNESIWRFALGMVLVGIGFNVKMMEAWLILPALLPAWTLGPSTKAIRARIVHRFAGLVAGGIALLAISFSWMTFVQMTPANQRPWVDSTATNNVFSLAFGYNGVARLLPSGWSIFGLHSGASSSPVTDVLSGGQSEAGAQGMFRLLSPQLGAQIGWLLPMAVFGLLVSWGVRRWWSLDMRRTSLVIWGGWLLTVAAFFSVAGFFHRYYLVMLAPAIAALVGIGIATIWNQRTARPWLLWLLPVAAGITIAVQLHVLNRFPEWHQRLEPVLLLGLAIVTVGIVFLLRSRSARVGWRPLGTIVIALTVAIMVLTPGTWAVLTSVDAATGTPNPAAGPSAPSNAFTAVKIQSIVNTVALSHRPANQSKSHTDASPTQDDVTAYLVSHQGPYAYLAVTRWAHDAWSMILATGDPVMALGGFTGRDPILTMSTFAQAISNKEVRYAWGNYGHAVSGRAPHTINEWVATYCTVVPAGKVDQAANGSQVAWGALKLYDCSAAMQRANKASPPASSTVTSSPTQSSSHASATPTAHANQSQQRATHAPSAGDLAVRASGNRTALSDVAMSDSSEYAR
ncbi:MAG: glycosyltransferase family 39 protein [Thermomicrobiales bacterium]